MKLKLICAQVLRELLGEAIDVSAQLPRGCGDALQPQWGPQKLSKPLP